MSELRIPAVADLNIRDFSGATITSSASKMVNTAIVKEATGEGDKIYVTQRPGISIFADASISVPDKKGRAVHHWGTVGSSYFVNNDTVYKDNYTTVVGTISAGAGRCYFFELGSYLVLIDPDNSEGWYINTSDVLTQITDVDFPSTLAHGGAQLDGYLFLMDTTGIIWQSALDDPTSWNSLDFIDAERENDGGVYLCKMKDSLVALGASTIEVFYDAGNASGSVLQRRPDVFYNIGCVAGEACWAGSDFVYFLGIDSNGQLSVYYMEGFALTKISKSDIDSYLSTNRLVNNIKQLCSGFSAFGGNYCLITMYDDSNGYKESLITLAFESSSAKWHIWTSSLSTLSGYGGIPLISWTAKSKDTSRYGEGMLVNGDFFTFNNIVGYGDSASGSLYVADGYVSTDYVAGTAGSSDTITSSIRIGDIHANTNKYKFMRSLSISCPFSQTAQNITVRWSDGSPDSYGADRTLNIDGRRKLTALGRFSRRHIELEWTTTEVVRIESIDVELDLSDV